MISRIFKIAVVLATLSPGHMAAQTAINGAFENLANSNCAKPVKTLVENDDNDRRSGELAIYRFSIPESQEVLFFDIDKAFDSDSADAYYMLQEVAGNEDYRVTALTYGTDGGSELVGGNYDTNYRVLCFRDTERKEFRHGYAMEWTHDDGTYKGRIIHAYGKKPTGNRKSIKLSAFGIDDSRHVKLDSLRLKLDSVKAEFSKNLNDPETKRQLQELGKVLQDGWRTIVIGSGDELLMQLGNLNNDLNGDDEEIASDDVAWLTAFNHYRNSFLHAARRGSSSASSYATSLLKLCRHATYAKLTDSEKRLCLKSIKEMKKATCDTFIQGLLDEAAAALRNAPTCQLLQAKDIPLIA